MDSRAKQRLTGAIILVALFVLLVPELLTGPRGTDAPGTAAEEGMRRYTIDLNAANAPAPPAESTTPPPVALPQPATSQPVSPQPANEQTLARPGDSAEPATAPVATVPAPVIAPVTTPVAAPPAATTAPREAQKPAPPPSVQPGSFVVQLGSFGSRDNADRLVRDMTAKGFAAFVAPIKSGGRELYRVRVGPTRDRAQAEALAAQLRRVGQSGAIVPIS
jgi:DedD protein